MPIYHRPIREIQNELRDTKRQRRDLIRAAGDDLGIDGTGHEAEYLYYVIQGLEGELHAARAARMFEGWSNNA